MYSADKIRVIGVKPPKSHFRMQIQMISNHWVLLQLQVSNLKLERNVKMKEKIIRRIQNKNIKGMVTFIQNLNYFYYTEGP